MTISIIVPAFNRERYIRQALVSLLRQRDEADLDIIVVDDGSTDGTREIVQSLASEAPQIRLFTQQNRGVSAARNTGLRQVKPDTELISFLDSDDTSPPGRFKRDMAAFAEDPSLKLVYCWMQMADRFDEESLTPAPDEVDVVFRGIHVGAGIYRRDFLQEIGEFDEQLRQAEDLDLIFRMFESKPRHLLPEVIGIYYRKHDDSLTSDRFAGYRGILRACHKSMARRKADPTLGNIHDLIQADPRYKGIAV